MQKSDCPHCGPTPVQHQVEKLGAFLDRLFSPFNRLGGWVIRRFRTVVKLLYIEYLLYGFLKILTLVGVGRIVNKFDERMSHRTEVLWKEAERRGIKMSGFLFLGRPTDVLIAQYKNKFLVFDALPRPEGQESEALEWMDNKGVMRKRFALANLPIARGGMFFSKQSALKFFEEVDKPVIVKPSEGSRSRHTTIHIFTSEELLNAIDVSKALSPWVIVEQQLSGFVHRATVIGGKVAGVMRREPPLVHGDGVKTVRDLVEEENKNPKRHDGIFHELEIGVEAEAELARQGLSWESVPLAGQIVVLHQKVGRSSGATNRDVTDITHPDNIVLFERVAQVLGDPLVGIDFIIEDISKSWTEQSKTGIIECNSLPFIDLHHYPFEGQVRDAAGALWDVVLPESR